MKLSLAAINSFNKPGFFSKALPTTTKEAPASNILNAFSAVSIPPPTITGASTDFATFATYANYNLDGSGAPFNNKGESIPSDFSLVGFRGTYEANAIDPSTINSWFTPAKYVGAVSSNNDWTLGWVRF